MKRRTLLNIISIWLSLVYSLSYAAESSSCGVGSYRTESLYGTYRVYDVCKYGGGLITLDEVKEFAAMDTIISEELFLTEEHSITNPKYKITCYYYPMREGHVDTNRWSIFYNYGADRRIVEVLEVYDLDHNPDRPFIYLEVINRNEIWSMSCGWLYKMKKVD